MLKSDVFNVGLDVTSVVHLCDSSCQIDSYFKVSLQGILNSISQNIGVQLLLKSGIQL